MPGRNGAGGRAVWGPKANHPALNTPNETLAHKWSPGGKKMGRVADTEGWGAPDGGKKKDPLFFLFTLSSPAFSI